MGERGGCATTVRGRRGGRGWGGNRKGGRKWGGGGVFVNAKIKEHFPHVLLPCVCVKVERINELYVIDNENVRRGPLPCDKTGR